MHRRGTLQPALVSIRLPSEASRPKPPAESFPPQPADALKALAISRASHGGRVPWHPVLAGSAAREAARVNGKRGEGFLSPRRRGLRVQRRARGALSMCVRVMRHGTVPGAGRGGGGEGPTG